MTVPGGTLTLLPTPIAGVRAVELIGSFESPTGHEVIGFVVGSGIMHTCVRCGSGEPPIPVTRTWALIAIAKDDQVAKLSSKPTLTPEGPTFVPQTPRRT